MNCFLPIASNYSSFSSFKSHEQVRSRELRQCRVGPPTASSYEYDLLFRLFWPFFKMIPLESSCFWQQKIDRNFKLLELIIATMLGKTEERGKRKGR
jgi:hypothetical protein